MRPLSQQLVDHLIEWRGLPWPLDFAALLGRDAPLVIEIGFGDGAFLEDRLAADPGSNYVGIELAWEPLQWCLKRLDRAAHGHVKLLFGDAGFALDRLIAPGSAAEFVINHPDPWPKDRHKKRRLIQPAFIAQLARALEPGGRVTIATDHQDYADWIEEVLAAQDRLVPQLETLRVAELPGRLVTRYQRKAREVGVGNHFFVLRHQAAEQPPTLGREEPLPMPNVTFQGAVDGDLLLRGFRPLTSRELIDGVDVTVNLLRAWRLDGEPRWMIEAVVMDGRLTQQIGLLLHSPQDGAWTLKVAAIGHPRVTEGVKRAVFHAATALRRRWPDLSVTTSTVGTIG